MSRKVDRWRREDLSKRYLDGVRGAIPLADYQIETILTIIEKTELEVRAFLDLGCGDGILGRAILSEYPEATGVAMDFSSVARNGDNLLFWQVPCNWKTIAP